MVKNAKVTKAEAARRAAQSQRDKKSSGRVTTSQRPSSMVKQPAKKRTGKSGPPPYARLVLDPCEASFAQSNFAGAGGSTSVRLPFRQIVHLPSSTKTLAGAATTSGPVADTLFAVLTPHCMVAGGGSPYALGIFTAPNETNTILESGGAVYDPKGLSGLSSYVGEMRPTAACLRITCMGSDNENTGIFYGYEGSAKSIIKHSGDNGTLFVPNVAAQDMIFNGQTSANTYETFESRINYPNAEEDWQEFRNMTVSLGQAGAGNSTDRSPDGTDPDFSQMPIAVVGVTSGTPGCRYLVDGAIVYEWYPKMTIGIAAPPRSSAPLSAKESTAKYVADVAKAAGGMLVGIAKHQMASGNANQVLGLLKGAYAAQAGGPPRITW